VAASFEVVATEEAAGAIEEAAVAAAKDFECMSEEGLQ